MNKKNLKSSKKFGEREFVKDLLKIMKGQEKKNPTLTLLHEHLEGSVLMVGLTGGIASGKSTVAGWFQKEKIPVIDADKIAREVVKPGKPAYKKIVRSFGEGILNKEGQIDRDILGSIVFSDDSKRALLESITHPEIFKMVGRQVTALKKKKTRVVIVDAALLFESGLSHHMHKNILIRTDPEIQKQRLMKRDDLSEARAWQRILSQMSAEEKEKRADVIIDNSGSLTETEKQAKTLAEWLKKN